MFTTQQRQATGVLVVFLILTVGRLFIFTPTQRIISVELQDYKRNYNPVKNITTEAKFKTCNEVQESRRQRLLDFCRNYYSQNVTGYRFDYWASRADYIIVIDDLKLMIVAIQKAMSTSLKLELIYLLSGEIPQVPKSFDARTFMKLEIKLRRLGVRYLNHYKPERVYEITRDYFKVVFVRHPLHRLTSAYQDKIVKAKEYYYALFKYLVLYTEKGIQGFRERSVTQYTPTFEEFLSYLLKLEPDYWDSHWMSMVKLGLPCEIGMDFVGHLESAHQDFHCLFKEKLNGSDKWYPTANTRSKSCTPKLFTKYINQLPKPMLDRTIDLYEDDFRAFGYNIF